MKRFLQICRFLCVVFLLIGILPFIYWQFIFTRGRTEHGLAADRAIVKAGNTLREKYGLYPVCIGGSCTGPSITSFALDFNRYGPAFDRDEARELILECLDIFHKMVNEDDDVRKFLSAYPFPLNGMHIGIYNFHPSGYSHDHPDILIVGYGSGKIWYLTEAPELKNTNKYTSEYEESYEEAVEIVKKQQRARHAALGMVCLETIPPPSEETLKIR